MPITPSDEYGTLRQEQLERYERIHDTAKYGAGALIAFLSFYYTQGGLSHLFALSISVSLLLLMGASAFYLFERIYTIGTYIAFVLERKSEARWHRMSRSHDEYFKSKNKPPPARLTWGKDAAQFATLIVFLFFVTIGAVVSKAQFLGDDIHGLWFVWGFLIIVLPATGYFCYQLFTMRKLRENIEDGWREYCEAFGGVNFSDPYEINPGWEKTPGSSTHTD